MLGMPGAVMIIDSDVFMVLVVLEFFFIAPLWSLATGIYAGRKARARWWLAVVNPLLFICGSWVFLEMGQLDFLYFAFCYLIIGLLSAFVTAVMRRLRLPKK